jgi:uncharacterized phage protein gp47/JayE
VPIPKITAAQFESLIRSGIEGRTTQLDTGVGPIPATVIQPIAPVFESLNDSIRKVSLITTVANEVEFDGSYRTDLVSFVSNEGMLPILGTRATAVCVFSRATAPTTDVPVQRGYPIGTAPDESTGATVTFVTSESATLPAASSASFFNLTTQRYELSVPVICVVEGSVGRVGANRINRPLRPLAGFDSVTNPAAAVGGRDVETNGELIERYLLAVTGRQLSTPLGIERFIRDNFPDAEDVRIVYGTNALLTRAEDDAGAVDAYILGEQLTESTENVSFFAVGTLLQISSPPLVSVTAVRNVTTATNYTTADYEVVTDTSGVSGSTRAVEGIRFTGTGAIPTVGNVIGITYTTNQLIRSIQSEMETDDSEVLGRDLLIRRAAEVSIVHQARIRVLAGFSPTTVLAAARTAITDFIAALELGEDVELSDLQAEVRQVSGVDNYLIDQNYRSDEATQSHDVSIADNEYARIDSADLTLTSI